MQLMQIPILYHTRKFMYTNGNSSLNTDIIVMPGIIVDSLFHCFVMVVVLSTGAFAESIVIEMIVVRWFLTMHKIIMMKSKIGFTWTNGTVFGVAWMIIQSASFLLWLMMAVIVAIVMMIFFYVMAAFWCIATGMDGIRHQIMNSLVSKSVKVAPPK